MHPSGIALVRDPCPEIDRDATVGVRAGRGSAPVHGTYPRCTHSPSLRPRHGRIWQPSTMPECVRMAIAAFNHAWVCRHGDCSLQPCPSVSAWRLQPLIMPGCVGMAIAAFNHARVCRHGICSLWLLACGTNLILMLRCRGVATGIGVGCRGRV